MKNNNAFWEDYGYKVQMLINSPANSGTIEQAEVKELDGELFIYQYGDQAIGEMVTLYWIVDPKTETILQSKFAMFGSPAAVAAHDMMALLCRNKTIDKATEITYKGLEYFLRDNPSTQALPDAKQYAISMALDAVRCAAIEYYSESKESDEVTVSSDSPMSLRAIKQTIKLHDLATVEEITNYTKAGLYDKSCIEPNTKAQGRDHYLSEILKETRAEIESDKALKQIPVDTPFREMNTPEQIETVNKALDENIRQFLVMDGGDIEILDIKENGAQIDIYIRYMGACNGCASSSTSTLFAIETTLKEKIDDQIRVLPI